jgi:Ycf66 protein N-terminus
MVNFGLNTASFLGIILAVAGAGLYFLRSVRPELSRDQDIAFTAIGIICGFILIFQGWRLDPILQFGQLLLSGSTIFFAYENIKLRGIATEQAKEKSKIVDERPVSRRYKAEIEDREYLDDRPRNGRRIRGDSDNRSSDSEDSEDRPRRRSTTRQLSEDRFATETPLRRRQRDGADRTSSLARRSTNDSWDNDDDDWEETDAVQVRRALPDADTREDRVRQRASTESDRQPGRRTTQRSSRDRDRNDNVDSISRDRGFVATTDDTEATPRRRPRTDSNDSNRSRDRADLQDTGDREGTMANYVNYEPLTNPLDVKIDPPSGLPPSGPEPVVFPDRY